MGALEYVAPVIDVGEGDFLLATAVQDDLLVFLAQAFKRRVDIEAIVLGQRGEHVKVVDVAPVPAANGALGQAGLRVQHNALVIEILFYAQPVTAAAGTGGIVEGKQPRLQFIDTVAALGAGEASGEADVLAARPSM